MKQLYIYQNRIMFTCMVVLCFIFGLQPVLAQQQDAQYTQYMYNTNSINPAYVGSQEMFLATLLYRNQWVGLNGAPKTLNFTAHSQLGRQTGGGITFTSDKIGPSQESGINFDFSYTIPIGDFSQIAFGLKAGVNLLNIDYSLLNIFNPTDPVFQQNIDNRLLPVVGLGAYFYDERFYVGLSVPNMLTTTFYDDVSVSNARKSPNFYFITGYLFDINRKWVFKPAFLAKTLKSAPVAFDISANFLYDNKFTMGTAYRFNKTISGLMAIQVHEQIQVGYAYDYNTSRIGNFSGGSHEIFLRYSFGDKRDYRLLVPRFF